MNKKIIISLISLGVLVAGLIVGLVLVRQRQQLRSKAAPATTLELEAPATAVRVGNKFSVNVKIDTGENLVAGVEMVVKYDPTKIRADKVNVSTFFLSPDVVGPVIDSTAGTINYTLLNSPGSTPKQGTGTVAKIDFTALASGNSVVSFIRDDTIVVAMQEGGQNVLVTAISATLTIQAATTATGTPSPTAAPTATPDDTGDDVGGTDGTLATATPTPTAIATSTPLGSTATPTPTATTTTTTTTSDPNATAPSDIPVTGLSWPTLLGIGVGFLLIIGSVVLIV